MTDGAKPGSSHAAVVLAAGRSTRMGGPNKLVQDWRGRPLVRHVVEAALASGAAPVVVVTGHQAGEVAAALAGLPVTLVPNAAFADGLSTSVRAGVAALTPEVERAAILLGDMPLVGPGLLGRLAEALAARPEAPAAVPVRDGTWGNPVMLGRSLFPAVGSLTGDAGARKLLEARCDAVVPVETGEDAVLVDIDTPEALAALRSR